MLTLALFFPVVAWSIQPRSPHGPHRHRSLRHAHSAKERARIAALMRQNPNATDEACGACVTAEDNLVMALNALVAAEEELRAAEGEAQNKTSQFAAHSAAVTTCTGSVSDVKENIRSHLDAVQSQVTSILARVEDDDPTGALVTLNAGVGVGLADLMNLWETEKESCDNMAATADTSHAAKAEADDLVEAKLAAAQDANASKVAAETEALDACEAMRAMGYGAPTQAPTAPPTQAPTAPPTPVTPTTPTMTFQPAHAYELVEITEGMKAWTDYNDYFTRIPSDLLGKTLVRSTHFWNSGSEITWQLNGVTTVYAIHEWGNHHFRDGNWFKELPKQGWTLIHEGVMYWNSMPCNIYSKTMQGTLKFPTIGYDSETGTQLTSGSSAFLVGGFAFR